ncbi:MAG: hypothetical protein KDA42_02005 [Planctomycetales bacterium]|nr:hypothetical protein [Planctomycetales bacterium]
MHTPGPWYTWKSEVNGRPAWLVTGVPQGEWTPQHRIVATIYGDDALTQANAAVICKAPSNTKALQAARRALSNPATTVQEEKKSLFDFSNLFGDTLHDDLVRARRKSKIEEYATAPMGRVFVALCVIFTVLWSCYLGVVQVAAYWQQDRGKPGTNFTITERDEFSAPIDPRSQNRPSSRGRSNDVFE